MHLFLCKIFAHKRTVKQINTWYANELWVRLHACMSVYHKVCLQMSSGGRFHFCPWSTTPVFKRCLEHNFQPSETLVLMLYHAFQIWNLQLTVHAWTLFPEWHACIYKVCVSLKMSLAVQRHSLYVEEALLLIKIHCRKSFFFYRKMVPKHLHVDAHVKSWLGSRCFLFKIWL